MTAKRKPRLTKAEEHAVRVLLPQIRSTLEAEVELLAQDYDAKLVVYACITSAIKLAERIGMSPTEFCKLVADTVSTRTSGEPGAIVVIEIPEE